MNGSAFAPKGTPPVSDTILEPSNPEESHQGAEILNSSYHLQIALSALRFPPRQKK